MDIVKRFFIGILIGIANLIPGVSGGTIAVVCDVYDDLIQAINGFFSDTKKRKANTLLLFNFGIGAIAGIVTFAKVIDYCLTYYSTISYAFFLGLILASIPMVWRLHSPMVFTFSRGIAFVCGASLVLITFLLPVAADQSIATITLDPSTIVFLLLSGFLAASAMVVPGISGSFILLILGTYPVIIEAINVRHFPVIGLVGVGAIVGIVVVSRVISLCLKHFPAATYYAIIGLLVGSLPKLWPGFQFDFSGLLAFVSFTAGCGLVTYFSGPSKI